VSDSSCRILIFSRTAFQSRHYSIIRICVKGEKGDRDDVAAASSEIRKHACGNSGFSVTHPFGSYTMREEPMHLDLHVAGVARHNVCTPEPMHPPRRALGVAGLTVRYNLVARPWP
jgi:hypothetical protein